MHSNVIHIILNNIKVIHKKHTRWSMFFKYLQLYMYIMYTMNKPCNTMDTLGTFVENAIKNLHCNINFSYWKCTVLFRQVKKSVKYLYPKYNLKFTPRPREVGRSRTVGTSSFLEGCSLISTFSQVYKSNAENWSGGDLKPAFSKMNSNTDFFPKFVSCQQ